MRRAKTAVLISTMVLGSAAAMAASAAEPPPMFQLASYATTERPEAVRACLLSLVAEQSGARPTATPAFVGLWEVEFRYRGLPTRIVVEETPMNGARVTYPKTLAWNGPDPVRSCG